jgi:hypothetical protein
MLRKIASDFTEKDAAGWRIAGASKGSDLGSELETSAEVTMTACKPSGTG